MSIHVALTQGCNRGINKVLRHVGLAPDDYRETDLVSINVKAARVLDLTDSRVLRTYGLSWSVHERHHR